MVMMFLNNIKQLHMIILEQEKEDVIELEDNKHQQIKCNKMKNFDVYKKELIVGHHLTINIFLKQICVVHFYFFNLNLILLFTLFF